MEKQERYPYPAALRRLKRRLMAAPGLLAYLLLLLLVVIITVVEAALPGEGVISPPEPLFFLVFNYLFFPFLTLLFVLYYYGRNPRGQLQGDIPVRRPGLEGLLVFLFYSLWMVFLVTKLLTDRYLLPLNHILGNFLEGSPLVSVWFADLLQVILEVAVVKLFPALLIFKVLFRYRWRDLGVSWHWVWTGAGFLALFAAGAFLMKKEPVPGLVFVVGSFFIQLAAVAFPEELFYRGLLQTRLERLFVDPLHGLVAATVLFGLAHFPHLLFQGYTVPQALVSSLFYQGNAGLFFGIIYYKTRNLGPLVLLHAILNSWG